jgi:hypothetical protein
MGDDGGLGIFFILGLAFGALLGFFAGAGARNDYWKQESLNRGVAAYDSQTGAWKWTVEPVKK